MTSFGVGFFSANSPMSSLSFGRVWSFCKGVRFSRFSRLESFINFSSPSVVLMILSSLSTTVVIAVSYSVITCVWLVRVSICLLASSRSSLYLPCFPDSSFLYRHPSLQTLWLCFQALSFVSLFLQSSWRNKICITLWIRFLSVHAGGVSLAGAGVQVVSAPVPFGFVISSGMDNKGRIKIWWDNNEDSEK